MKAAPKSRGITRELFLVSHLVPSSPKDLRLPSSVAMPFFSNKQVFFLLPALLSYCHYPDRSLDEVKKFDRGSLYKESRKGDKEIYIAPASSCHVVIASPFI